MGVCEADIVLLNAALKEHTLSFSHIANVFLCLKPPKSDL